MSQAHTQSYLRRIVFPLMFGTILFSMGIAFFRRHKYVHSGQDERKAVWRSACEFRCRLGAIAGNAHEYNFI